jgi:regulator of sigma E protease
MALVQGLQYAASFIVALGIIVFVHEFGHFATAKAFGMRVFIFSFGFGRRLAGFKWGDTDCRLSLIPLGGYVKLEGEPDDRLSGDDPGLETRVLSDGTLVRVENPDAFTARPRWQRILVYLAGPFMNAVLTVTVFTVFHMVGFWVDAAAYDRAFVGAVEPGSPAARAGVQPGDELVSLAGARVDNWESAQYKILIRPDADVRLGLRRGAELREVELRSTSVLDPDMKMEVGHLGLAPLTRLGRVRPGEPAEQAGLRSDDGILAIDGQAVRSFTELARMVRDSQGRTLGLSVLRDGERLTVAVTPRVIDGAPRIGVEPKLVRKQFAFPGAVRESLARTWSMTLMTVDTLGQLVTGKLSPKSLSGPLGIAKASGEAAGRGADEWFSLLAFISLQVGILNLLPIAPLDGGHLAILALESVRRRDLTERAKAWILNTGVALLLLLIAVVMWSDLSKTFIGRYLPF